MYGTSYRKKSVCYLLFRLYCVIYQKRLDNVEYLKCMCIRITNDARCTMEYEIQDCHSKSSIQQDDSFYQKNLLKFKEEISKLLHL